MSNKNIGQKRKLEHWELVTLLLMVYDFLAIGLSYDELRMILQQLVG